MTRFTGIGCSSSTDPKSDEQSYHLITMNKINGPIITNTFQRTRVPIESEFSTSEAHHWLKHYKSIVLTLMTGLGED